MQLSGRRYYSPSLGRWVNRDPIGEIGGVNLLAFVDNDGIRNIDPFGWRKRLTDFRRVKGPCPCTDKAVNLKGREAANDALKMSQDGEPFVYQKQAYEVEYCGAICCNATTQEIRITGPVRGTVKIDSVTESLIFQCNPLAAKKCSELQATEGKFETAAYYHSHPQGTGARFSVGDFLTAHDELEGYPFFMASGDSPPGEVMRLDPVRGLLTDDQFPSVRIPNCPGAVISSVRPDGIAGIQDVVIPEDSGLESVR